MLPVLDNFPVMFRKRHNFEQLSKNVKYGYLKKNVVIYHKEGERVIIGLFFMVIFPIEALPR